jgi:predicted RNase H-like HicB family nuclease
MKTRELTVRVEREHLSDGQPVYVALCLELDMACQGDTVEEATANVTDAVMSFFEVASPSEIARRLPGHESGSVFLTRIEVPIRQTADLVGA